jgi:epoxyqueuosine reductase
VTVSAAAIKEKALQLGFDGCGIIPATTFDEYYKALDQRGEAFPESKERYEALRAMGAPPDGAKSIIVCVLGYNHYKIPHAIKNRIGKYYMFHTDIPYSPGFQAKTEFGEYLKLSGLGIIQGSPPARWAAVKAGLGKFGRNNFFYTEAHGSYVHIATWMVDKELAYEKPVESTIMTGCHESCNRCMAACPTKALDGAFSMNYNQCVVPLIYKKEAPSEEIQRQMGQWIYGCDACQDACPLNRGKLTEQEEFPLLSQFATHLQPEKILGMTEADYANIILPRLWYAGPDGLETWKRNAKRAMTNEVKKAAMPLSTSLWQVPCQSENNFLEVKEYE